MKASASVSPVQCSAIPPWSDLSIADRIAFELAAIVADDHLRLASSVDETGSSRAPPAGRKRTSGDQRSLAASGLDIGARVPFARFRPPRFRTVSIPSR